MKREHSNLRALSGGALAFLLAVGCASEAGSTDAGIDSTVPRCVPGMTIACACVGGASGAQTCTAAGVYDACACPDASAPTDAATDAWTLDVPVRPLGPRLITPQSISRTTTQRPTFRWVLPDGVTRARVTVARDRALTMDVHTGMATGTSWRPTEPLPFAVWFWRVEGLGDDGGVVWTSPTWEFRAPRRDTAVDSSWGTWRDFNGDGYDDLASSGVDMAFRGSSDGLVTAGTRLRTPFIDADGFWWRSHTRAQAADFNGDGVSDLVYHVFGERYVDADGGAHMYEGSTRLYIYMGNAAGLTHEPDLVLDDAGQVNSPQFTAVLAGDFDGDGFGDVLAIVDCELDPGRDRARSSSDYAAAA